MFASDALSSVAYATEEMLAVMLPAAAYGLVMRLSGGVVLVLAILVLSYRQTIKAYVVTRDTSGCCPPR